MSEKDCTSEISCHENLSLSVPGRKEVEMEASDFVYTFTCDPCQEEGQRNAAFGFCADCTNYLCKECYIVHCRPLPTRKHKLMDRDHMPESRPRLPTGDHGIDEKCVKHSGKIVEYFCQTHDAIGCSVCITLDHKLCEGVKFVQDLTVDRDKAHLIMQYLSTLQSKAKDKQVLLKQWLARSEQSLDNAIQNAGKFSVKIKSSVEMLEKKFEKTTQSHRDTLMEFKGHEIDNLEDIIQQTESLNKDMSCYDSAGKEACLFIAMKKAEQILVSNSHVTLHAGPKFNYKFMPNKDLVSLQDNIHTLGEVHVECKVEEDKDVVSNTSGIKITTSNAQYSTHV